jgi:L-fuconolactonase
MVESAFMLIDSHHHFWQYSLQEYAWISDSMSVLKRDYLPPDLNREIKSVGFDGVVSVQARQSLRETQWLLELAEKNDFIKGVVGWVPLKSIDLSCELQKFAGHSKLKAVRHVLQDEPDDNYMLRPEFDRGISLLKDFHLRYDILIFERHLKQSIKLVDRHPDLTFILDHVAKPRIKEKLISPWRENINELAKRPNIYCKISGMATEADHSNWTETQLLPYMETALDAFGPRRLLFGSDWPVCLLATPYRRWFETVTDFIAPLSDSERNRIMGGTAIEAYGLN